MPKTHAKQSLPLSNVRALVGRAQGQSKVLTELLSDLGATAVEIPFIEIRPPKSRRALDTALKKLSSYDWLILTSVNGVRALVARMTELKIPTGALSKLNVAAIGPATKAALEKCGVSVTVTPRRYVAEAVVEALCERVPGKKVLLVRAQVARDVIPRELAKAGAEVGVVAAYETVLPTASREKLRKLLHDPAGRPNVVAFTSSSTVRNFAKLARGLPLDGIRFVSIGPVTSATMRELGLRVDAEAREYTMSGIVGAVAELNL
jgi:uroporphyrinogen-III synthase